MKTWFKGGLIGSIIYVSFFLLEFKGTNDILKTLVSVTRLENKSIVITSILLVLLLAGFISGAIIGLFLQKIDNLISSYPILQR